ncbi:ATP-dependent DNA helicase RecQ [Nodosilinea sp. LEGE 06152]|uniref:RecQ family ATP-dependent DNA helicase n=1 Tax=Nodosilinea sp. LEGE 06152 TaxID=2777966 RepID=UPI001880677A|nr:RecQ family ATP-dependent DNA helicase [Nodosilinea sp. LEGE 06152]MBE9159223.1 ATP-dependent DNA helicase RecQ [Nodosilinea sp. LEGE 06152]
MAESSVAWSEVLQAFQHIWGYSDFRSPQDAIVKALLEHRDVLVVLPTGGGKSLCFQLPALLQSGLTLVVSPLVALMENQVQDLHDRALPAATLHSQLPPPQRRKTLQALERQALRLLYVSPETLLSPPVWERLCQPNLRINGLILDEAHCLVQWGETFRPAYRRLGAVRKALLDCRPPGTTLPIAAFTATADPAAQKTLKNVLQLQSPQVVRLNPHRPNLDLRVKAVVSEGQRKGVLRRYLQQHSGQAGLVYVRTRRDSEALAEQLADRYRVAPYHAGLSSRDRRQIEADWMADKLQFVVCTSAFGMGISKSNTRWVVHYQAPCTITEYVQEVGRAGRDGNTAEALTLVSEPTGWLEPGDRQRAKFFEAQTQLLQQKAQRLVSQIPPSGDVRDISQQFEHGAISLSWLHSVGQLEWVSPFHYQLTAKCQQPVALQAAASQQMHQFLHSRQCRWQGLLVAFGFRTEAQRMGNCKHCDNCARRDR